jgi:hypothetical protein
MGKSGGRGKAESMRRKRATSTAFYYYARANVAAQQMSGKVSLSIFVEAENSFRLSGRSFSS